MSKVTYDFQVYNQILSYFFSNK